jgi:hypothetical protein
MIGLSAFQEEVLEAFFSRESGFFLTGGAALTGYHLHHREVERLQLRTLEDRVRVGEAALLETAGDIGAKVQRLESPEAIGRFLVRRDDDSTMVEIAQDFSPQVEPDKAIIGKIAVDGPKEIAARILSDLPAHCELGDLVDLRALEIAGHTVEDHLAAAAHRNPELKVSDLVRALSEIEFEDGDVPSGDVSAPDLRSYLAVLALRLTSVAATS